MICCLWAPFFYCDQSIVLVKPESKPEGGPLFGFKFVGKSEIFISCKSWALGDNSEIDYFEHLSTTK